MKLFSKGKKTEANPKEEQLFLQRAETLDKILGHFLHEVNYPLRQAESQIEAILRAENKFDSKTRQMLINLEDTINRIKALHVFLHEFGMQRTDMSNTERQEFYNLNSLAEVAVHMSKMEASYQRIGFEFSYSSRCNVLCNKTEIIHAIIQIIKNSIDSFDNANHSKRVLITTKYIIGGEGLRYAKLEIANNGASIPKEIQPNIFDQSFTTKINASGLGLTIAKELIEKNGGKIEFVSPFNIDNSHLEKNIGTMFRIVFKDQRKI